MGYTKLHVRRRRHWLWRYRRFGTFVMMMVGGIHSFTTHLGKHVSLSNPPPMTLGNLIQCDVVEICTRCAKRKNRRRAIPRGSQETG